MVSVGSGRYALAADAVTQIMDPTLDRDFRRDVGSGEAVHRGARCRVVDLHEADGGGEERRLYLVLGQGAGQAMVPVDSAEAIQDVPAGAIAPLPSFIFVGGRRLFRGIFSDGRELRLLVDVGAIL